MEMRKCKKRIRTIIFISMLSALLVACGEGAEQLGDTQITESKNLYLVEETTDVKESEFLETEDCEEIQLETEVTQEEEVNSETEMQEVEAIVLPIETENESEILQEVYTYVDLSQVMYAKQPVNVRDLPSASGNKLGGISSGQQVTVTGQCNETNWYRISYNGKEGFVSNNYLVVEKPVVVVDNSSSSSRETPASNSVTSESSTPSVTVPEQEETVGELVWVPVNGGKKYHKTSTCSNMKDPMQVSVETALANGYTACKRCHK